jgi:hypothetical protein
MGQEPGVEVMALLALTLSACAIPSVTVSRISPPVDIRIDQVEFDQFSLKPGIQLGGPTDGLLDEFTRVELHDGFIRYLGTVVLADQSRVEGSFDVSLGAKDGVLNARIISVNIPGIDLHAPIVARANRELAVELGQLATDTAGDVLFKEVTVQEGHLRLNIQVNTDEVSIPPIEIQIDQGN